MSIASSAAPPTDTVPRQAILLLSCAAFASAMSMRVNDPLLPMLAKEFGVSLGAASWVITVFSIAYGISQLLFGPLGDRYGKYLVIAWACVASSVTAASCALAPDFEFMLAARLFAGATAAAVIPLSMAWIGDVVPYEKRQPVLARFLVGQIFGLSTGVLMGGLAADHLGRQLPFFLIAAIYLLVSVALLSSNKRLPLRARQTMAHAGEGHVLLRMAAGFGEVLAKPWARVVLVTVFLEATFLYGPFAFIASHLNATFGISLATAGSLVMFYGLGGLLFAVISQWTVRRLGEAGMAACGGIAIAASFCAMAFAPAWWWAAPGCFVAGFGFYMLHNTLQTNATQMAPARRGAAVAAFASVFFIGQAVGVWVASVLIGTISLRTVIALGAAGVLAVGLGFSWVRVRAQRLHAGDRGESPSL